MKNKDHLISVNFWDDYEDGGDTYAYVEGDEHGELVQELAMTFLHGAITSLPGYEETRFVLGGDRIDVKNISHNQLWRLVKQLQAMDLKVGELGFDIYSES